MIQGFALPVIIPNDSKYNLDGNSNTGVDNISIKISPVGSDLELQSREISFRRSASHTSPLRASVTSNEQADRNYEQSFLLAGVGLGAGKETSISNNDISSSPALHSNIANSLTNEKIFELFEGDDPLLNKKRSVKIKASRSGKKMGKWKGF